MKLTTSFFEDIRSLILSGRATIARGVDLVQVYTNFEIGRRIVEQEQKGKERAAYGQEVIRQLAARLTDEFGRGYSKRNLELMRQFFVLYSDRAGRMAQSVIAQLGRGGDGQASAGQPTIAQSMIAQSVPARIPPSATGESGLRPFTLSWTHYIFLLSIKNPDERSFYEIEAVSENWTVRELKRQFDSSLYERLALSRDRQGIRRLAREGQVVATVKDVLKEPLVLEFLGLHESHRYSESDLETAILSRLEQFLLELGKGFLFEARQRRFTFDGEHYFVDLVFYNRLLRCYVLLDLKLGRLTHQDLGQMQMYVNTFDREVKLPDEASTIGIILCKQKHRALVAITLPKDANVHAHEYRLCLPSKAELQRKLLEWSREAGDE